MPKRGIPIMVWPNAEMDVIIHHGTVNLVKPVVELVVTFLEHVNMPKREIPTMEWLNAEMDVIIHRGTDNLVKPVA
jgi:hypothetical protein